MGKAKKPTMAQVDIDILKALSSEEQPLSIAEKTKAADLTLKNQNIDIKKQDLIQEKIETAQKQKESIGIDVPTNKEFGEMTPAERRYNYEALSAYKKANPKLGIQLPVYPEYLREYDAQIVEKSNREIQDNEIAEYNKRIETLESEINSTRTERQETTTYELKSTGKKHKGEKIYKEYPKTSFANVAVPAFPEGSLQRQQKEQELYRLYTERDAITGYEALIKEQGRQVPVNPANGDKITEEKYVNDYNDMVDIGSILSDIKQMKAELMPAPDQAIGLTNTQAMVATDSYLLNSTQYRARLKNFLARYNRPDGKNTYIEKVNECSYLIDQYGEDYFIKMSDLKNRAGY